VPLSLFFSEGDGSTAAPTGTDSSSGGVRTDGSLERRCDAVPDETIQKLAGDGERVATHITGSASRHSWRAYFTKREDLELVVRYYDADYKLFNLTRPTWEDIWGGD
jgi:hypothetical protein